MNQYDAGFTIGLNMAKENKELALQYLDSLERAEQNSEAPEDDWLRQNSRGAIAGIQKGLQDN